MSRQDVQIEVLEPMQRIFLPPRQYDEAGIKSSLEEYARALEHYCDTDLRAAWGTVRDTHQNRSWPLPGAFVFAASKARMEREFIAGETKQKEKHKGGESPWRVWEQVRHGQKAHEAAQLGVAWAFKCAIMSGVEPNFIDLDRLVRDKAQAGVTFNRIENDKPLFARDGREIGIVRGPSKDLALSAFRGLVISEAQTAQEIGFAGQSNAPQNDLQGFAL